MGLSRIMGFWRIMSMTWGLFIASFMRVANCGFSIISSMFSAVGGGPICKFVSVKLVLGEVAGQVGNAYPAVRAKHVHAWQTVKTGIPRASEPS